LLLVLGWGLIDRQSWPIDPTKPGDGMTRPGGIPRPTRWSFPGLPIYLARALQKRKKPESGVVRFAAFVAQDGERIRISPMRRIDALIDMKRTS
jgi:hypothetical protein